MVKAIPRCACGSNMVAAHNDNYFICENCDMVQPIQNQVVAIVDGVTQTGQRERTELDIRFDAEMKVRMNEWYGG